MDRDFVASSNLMSVGYDSDTMILEVEFRQGGLYQYFEVPVHIYDGLMGAPSKGTYFQRFVRNKYRTKKIR